MPLLPVNVGFCTPQPAPPAEQDAAGPEAWAACERGGPCPRCVDLQSLKAAEVRRRVQTAVNNGNRDALAELLREAASAHHAWEVQYLDGATDEDWPTWYASYLLGGVTA